VPFGEHVLYGSNMALPKKHDIVFQVMQVGWQGVCVLAYPQGHGAGLSELSCGDACDDERLSIILLQPT
jgi:hypothetical protein